MYLIEQDDATNKWLVFVDEIEKGKVLKQKLTNQLGKCVAFIEADTKRKSESSQDYRAFKSIQERECFDERVLISTSVLDNGINIHDPMVKHIVIFSLDKTTTLQMIGRKRLDDGEIVDIHFMLLSDFAETRQRMNLIKQCVECASLFHRDIQEFLTKHWGSLTPEMQKLFLVIPMQSDIPLNSPPPFLIPQIQIPPAAYGCQITLNLLGEYKLWLTLAALEALEKLWVQHGEDTVPQLIYQWLNADQILEESRNIGNQKAEAHNAFQEWISVQVDRSFTAGGSELDLFYKEFLGKAKGLFRYELRGQNEKGRRADDINKILKELEIAFRLKKRNNTWRFEEQTVEGNVLKNEIVGETGTE